MIRTSFATRAALCAASLAAAPTVSAQYGTEAMISMYSEPNEFYLFDMTDVQIMDYKEERDVRICVDKSAHAVPLEIDYDGKNARVRPGDCFNFEAKRVLISPAESLESGWDMSGTVETEQRR